MAHPSIFKLIGEIKDEMHLVGFDLTQAEFGVMRYIKPDILRPELRVLNLVAAIRDSNIDHSSLFNVLRSFAMCIYDESANILI